MEYAQLCPAAFWIRYVSYYFNLSIKKDILECGMFILVKINNSYFEFCYLRNPEFQMFQSPMEHSDLIFSDSCTQLYKIDVDVESYLGGETLELIRRTDPRMCNNSSRLRANLALLLSLYIVYMLFF